MDILEALQQIRDLESQLILSLDHPKSVKSQIKRISFIQKQLRALKKEINSEIRGINQNATQTGADSVVSVSLDLFGKHKWAGKVRTETRKAIQREKRANRQPYMNLKDAIDSLLLEGDRLKLVAEEYLLNYSSDV